MYLVFRYLRAFTLVTICLFVCSSMSFGQRGEVQDPNDIPDANDIYALVGFAAAAEDANGLSTTTGGQGGETIVVTTGEDLNTALKARRDKYFDQNFPPLIIIVEGTLTFPQDRMMGVKETYNLSILGDGNDAIIEGFGLNIDKSFNIIVRNIEFRNCPDDAINIEGIKSHHIWIDHCTLSDSPDIDLGGERHDGLLDIKDGASFITVSWNHFYNHRKTCLLGHSDDNGWVDTGRLKVTYHHNWFDNTYSRHPRVRFGECHVFNNYYDNSRGGMGYGIASTQEADVVIEANYFCNVRHPAYCGYGASSPGDIVEFDNIYFNSGVPETRGDAFEPLIYYDYIPDNAFDIPLLVTTGAGVGKINIEDFLN
jgi:pectate lyase